MIEDESILLKKNEEEEKSYIFKFNEFLFQQKLSFLVYIELIIDDIENSECSYSVSVFSKEKYIERGTLSEEVREMIKDYHETQLKSIFL